MAEAKTGARWRPSTTHLVAGALVIAGFLLASVSWWFILLTALGTFGPGILREFGWLRDKDEFQRRAEHRAGYHAFLTAGFVAFVIVAIVRSGDRTIDDTQELATFFLALLWFIWFFSALIAYWGPPKTATRVLLAFGCAWLAFTIISNLGSEWSGWAALLLHPLLAAPFFILAWLAGRWPRLAGVLLIATAAGFFRFFGFFSRGNFGLVTEGVTVLLFLGPLVASGVALLFSGKTEAEVP